MEAKFTVWLYVARPVGKVYEAVADPDQLSRYFTTGGAKGRLETGATVIWDFHDFPGAFPVRVVDAVSADHIELRWDSKEGEGAVPYQTNVRFSFEPTDDGRTKVSVSEDGWHQNEAGVRASYDNCMGWSQMLCALKVWLEHGINLRDGAYK